MAIPNEIPANARVVVRVSEGVDPTDHRMNTAITSDTSPHGTVTRWI